MNTQISKTYKQIYIQYLKMLILHIRWLLFSKYWKYKTRKQHKTQNKKNSILQLEIMPTADQTPFVYSMPKRNLCV